MEKHTNKEVTLKELREGYYKLRSFEISNLWQRSIFLSAMIVLLFTIYGYMISKIIDSETQLLLLINEICSGISIIGLVFSIIWIMMAKGSKAWFEVYERRICTIEDEKELNINKKYSMQRAECKPWSLNNNLFNNSAGAYSVSKLNILIGQVLLIIWSVATIIHYIGIINHISFSDNCEMIVGIVIATVIPILVFYIIIVVVKNCWAKSNSLE